MREKLESLFHACEAGDQARVESIVDDGLHDVNGGNYWQSDIDPRGWRRAPLHIAIIHGHLALARWLLENGADPNIRTRFGDTPLNLALEPPVAASWLEAVTLLVSHGADPAAANDEGESPMSRARRTAAVWEKVAPLFGTN